ncbi:serine/threonine-protein kinase 11-interacting protein, partial [Plakobranchus ocellatus]
VEDLTVLEELDLGENCISDHSCLEPLVYLTRLRQLQLDANPLFYHRKHRALTASCLSRQTLGEEFELDKKKLTISEINYFGPRSLNYMKKPVLSSHVKVSGRRSSTPERGPSPSSGIGTEVESNDIVVRNTRKGKRKRLKPRNTEILETSGDIASSRDASPGTTPRQWELMRIKRKEALKTKEQVEELRRHYGPNWLQAIEDRNIFNKEKPASTDGPCKSDSDSSARGESKASGKRQRGKSSKGVKSALLSSEPSSKSDTGDEAGIKSADQGEVVTLSDEATAPAFSTTTDPESEGITGLSDSDAFTSSGRTEAIVNPIMAALARLADGHSEGDSDTLMDPNKNSRTGSMYRSSNSANVSSGEERSKSSTGTFQGLSLQDAFSKRDSKVVDLESVDSSLSLKKDSVAKTGTNADFTNSLVINTSVPSKQTGNSMSDAPMVSKLVKQMEMLSPVKSDEERDDSTLKTNYDASPNVDRSTSLDSSADIHLDEAEIAEPVFATLPLQNKMILLSWSLSYLIEKDITGKFIEKLELKSLLSMENRIVGAERQEVNKSDVPFPPGISGDEQLDKVQTNEGEKSGYPLKPKQSNAEENVELTLRFDYVNRERQKRIYELDATDSQAVTSYLQPFLDIRMEEAKAKLAAVMQCLKCNRTFLKSEVLKKKKDLPSSGNLQDLKLLQEIMDKTTFICPKCGSSIVIDYNPAASAVPSTSSQQGKSASSTPVGSYKSGDGWPEKAKLKQQPAKLRRMKSADKFESLAGGRLSQMLVRKDSTDSLSTSPSRRSSIRSNGSLVKDARADSTASTRERSNAFSANKISRTLVKRQRSVSEQGQLEPVEDYFAEETMTHIVSSSQLAAMTTSLRGDSSTTGSTAAVRRLSLPQPTQDKEKVVFESQARSIDKLNRNFNEMVDSGFASEANSQYLDQVDSFGGRGVDKPSRDSELTQTSGSSVDRGAQSEADTKRGVERKLSTASQHKHQHLSTMEELVNSLVREGQNISGQESGENMSLGQKSMSVSAFRDLVSSSPSQNRRERSMSRSSLTNTIPGVQRSDSASSIAVLSRGNSVGEDACSEAVRFTLGGNLNPVEIQSTDQRSQSREGENEAVSRVVSPLNSDICSSMVSSIYENSVKPVVEDGICGLKPVSSGIAIANSLGDNARSSSSSSEDLTSIYDMPRKPKNMPSKKHSKAGKSKPIQTTAATGDSETEAPNAAGLLQDKEKLTGSGDFENDVSVPGDDALQHLFQKEPSIVQLSDHPDDVGVEEDSGSDSDVEALNDLDVTPQYAFHHLNHRLTLFLMMTLFEAHEEFVCKIQGEISQYIINESYEGIFIMSSARFYILKIVSEDHTQDPDKWVNCIEIQPIPELRHIDVGLGGQSLRVEFVTDCSSYTIVTRNRDRTSQFVDVLHTNLAKYAVSHGIASHVVVNEDVDQATLDNLDKDVLSKVIPDQKLLLYCMGFIQRGNQDRFPVSFVISTSDICLVRTCHQWPQPRLQAPITLETVGRQFVVLERQLVNNVASVNVDESSMRKISVELFNEKEGRSMHWNITVASRQTTVDFVHALSIPWEREFGVDMDIGYTQLDF